LFNFRRKHNRHHTSPCCCKKAEKCCADKIGQKIPEGCINLAQAPEDKRVIVRANSDIKTMEMGLYPGSMITLMHNDTGERNIIVKIHDQKYVIPRETAEQIYVKV
jgi:Fe2+ transport system protein FeoA